MISHRQHSYLCPHRVLQVIPIVIVIFLLLEHHPHHYHKEHDWILLLLLFSFLFRVKYFFFALLEIIRLNAIERRNTPIISVLFSHHFVLIGKKHPSIDITDCCCFFFLPLLFYKYFFLSLGFFSSSSLVKIFVVSLIVNRLRSMTNLFYLPVFVTLSMTHSNLN